MNTVIQCIILLSCTAICTSAVIKNCRCLKTSKAVKPSLIVDVREYGPRPYCNKEEVIVTLKDRTSRCLDPTQYFTKKVLQLIRIQRAKRVATMNNIRAKATTMPATASATASVTV